MGFWKMLFRRKASAIKIRNKNDFEQYLLTLVYWPPVWKEVRAGRPVKRQDIAVGGQIQALVTLGEATQYLNGEKEQGQLSESARFVVGGLRDVFHATEGRRKMLAELEASVRGPRKAMLSMLLSLHGGPSASALGFKFRDATGAKRRLADFQE